MRESKLQLILYTCTFVCVFFERKIMKNIQREFAVFCEAENSKEKTDKLNGLQFVCSDGMLDRKDIKEILALAFATRTNINAHYFKIFDVSDILNEKRVAEILSIPKTSSFKISVIVGIPSHEEVSEYAIGYVFSEFDIKDTYGSVFNELEDAPPENLKAIFEKYSLTPCEQILEEYGTKPENIVDGLKTYFADILYIYQCLNGTFIQPNSNNVHL